MTDRGRRIIIIGAGHNGLVCAATLARAGHHVTVFEAATSVGGAAITREFAPGFRVSAGAHLLHALDPAIAREMKLADHGLDYAATGLGTVGLDPDGQWLRYLGAELEGPGASDADREAIKTFDRQFGRFAALLRNLRGQVPPRLGTRDRGDLLALGKLGWAIRRLGRDDMREFLRIAGINVYDVLNERFESPLLKGAISLDGTLGTFAGPRSNNTVFNLLNRYDDQGYAIPAGGMGTVTAAMADAARQAGADIRTGCPVRRVMMDFDRACGVRLETGDEHTADVVISNADPRTTLGELLGLQRLEAGFAHRVKHIRAKGGVAKLHLALDGLPAFNGLDEALTGQRLVIAPDPDYVERAFNHAKYGEFSAQPAMEITIPSLHDNRLAAPGQHVLSANVQWAPHDLKGGWNGARRHLVEACLLMLEQYAPGIRDQVLHHELRSPWDLAAEFGNAGGHWHHAELTLDQSMMLRPVPGAAQYATPVNGLYLCGAGSHPGGGIMGNAGRNAAWVVDRDLAAGTTGTPEPTEDEA
ncbi:NAD(P)/FAD-dependent oxidoreductase [Marinihelvus fidelis]|uniref:Pyridine nucleotide-disulfide oxidoreductase domain-containing protein 2 n=1 Tax=Marinihelvus fidelis TaxID=2613842 RepID=A0A5N0T7Q9_9GAMM|nr:NAD(P)/FAD-dependent oxidoreductase [Marinihelvus fidelis]KAA9130534.1 NAD(P)/FAD-dependent oxidoreductase [Marinihelvus fidelis]